MTRHRIAEIFARALSRNELQASQEGWQVVNDILRCRTAALGGHLYECTDCKKSFPLYNSCRNRHCPQCQREASAAWLTARTKELLPVPYFHLVFTVPHELNGLFLQNKQVLFDIFFRSVTKTLHDVAKRRLGGSLGFFSVLHSWGRKMEFHPHLHTVVTGAIFNEDQTIKIASENYLLPKNVLAVVFRAVFIKALVRAFRRNKLAFFGNEEALKMPSNFFRLIKQLKNKHWLTYAKKPFAGPDTVLKYLARYTHKVAISESRILNVKDDRVTFTFKDYADESKTKTLVLSLKEFSRRFLLHVLPKGFVRIRYSGFLSPAKRKRVLEKLKAHFHIIHPIAALPKASKVCPYCKNSNLTYCCIVPPIHYSSHSHKTKALSLVA